MINDKRIRLGRALPRWTLDGPGLQFYLHFLPEFSIINGLIFDALTPKRGAPLEQIVAPLFYIIA